MKPPYFTLKFFTHYILLPGFAHWWQILIALFFFFSLGYALILLIPAVRNKFNEFVDRLILAPFFGLSAFTLLFMILNALLRIKICPLNIWLTYFFTVVPLYVWIYLARKKIDFFGKRTYWQLIIFACIVVVFIMTLIIRLEHTLDYPDQLLDSDPYRHHPRTEWVIKTGYINEWEPWIIGEVPIYEMQGCYVIAAVIHFITGIDSWYLWKYASIIFGVMSVIAVYFWGKYAFGKNNVLGLVAASCLACIPVHISRTNIGFSEPWGLPFLALALLFFFLYLKEHKLSFAIIFGAFYTTIALHNMVPNVFMLSILTAYTAYMIVIRRRFKILIGIGLSMVVFGAFLAMWNFTYMPISLVGGGSAHKSVSHTEMKIESFDFTFEDMKKSKEEIEFGDIVDRVKKLTKARWDFLYKDLFLTKYIQPFHLYFGMLGLLVLMIAPIDNRHRLCIRKRFREHRVELIGQIGKYFTLFDTPLRFAALCLFATMVLLVCSQLDVKFSASVYVGVGLVALLYAGLVGLVPGFEQTKEESVQPITHRCPECKKRYDVSQRTCPECETALVVEKPSVPQYIKDYFDVRVFFILFFFVYFANMYMLAVKLPLINDEIPTFTNKIYRYILFPAYGLAMMSGFMIYVVYKYILNLISWAFLDKRSVSTRIIVQAVLLTIVFSFTFQVLRHGKKWGSWPPSPNPSEVRAYKWINENLPEDAIVFCNWFIGDFLRSYCQRRYIIVDYLRANIRQAHEQFDLDIPVPENGGEILDYAKEHADDGNFYVYVSKWGPSEQKFGLLRNPAFRKVGEFPGNPPAFIYELTSNKVRIDPETRKGAMPIAGVDLPESEAGKYVIRNIYALTDGTIGNNKDTDAASTHPASGSPIKAWFGIDFGEKKRISHIKAAPFFYAKGSALTTTDLNNNAVPRSDMTYLATHCVFQYWDGKQWQDIAGSEVRGNEDRIVKHSFDPITTTKARIYIFSERNSNGEISERGFFRAACLEFMALEEP